MTTNCYVSNELLYNTRNATAINLRTTPTHPVSSRRTAHFTTSTQSYAKIFSSFYNDINYSFNTSYVSIPVDVDKDKDEIKVKGDIHVIFKNQKNSKT